LGSAPQEPAPGREAMASSCVRGGSDGTWGQMSVLGEQSGVGAAAQGSGGVPIPGGVQNPSGCGPWEHGLAGTVVLGWQLDLMTFEAFSNLWFSASVVSAGHRWVGCTTCPWLQLGSDGSVVPCFRTWFSRHGGVGLMVGLDDLRGLCQAVIFCVPGLGRVVMGWLYHMSLVAAGQWWVAYSMLQDTV